MIGLSIRIRIAAKKRSIETIRIYVYLMPISCDTVRYVLCGVRRMCVCNRHVFAGIFLFLSKRHATAILYLKLEY